MTWSSTQAPTVRPASVIVDPRRRDLERVRDEVVEHLGEPAGEGAHRDRPVVHLRGSTTRAPPRPGARRRRARERSPPRRHAPRPSLRGVGPRESEQTCRRAPTGGGVSRNAASRSALFGEVLEPQPQRGERRAQLVRGVGDELVLRMDEPLELGDGAVEDRRERLDLGRAAADVGARLEMSLPHRRRRFLEPLQRAG